MCLLGPVTGVGRAGWYLEGVMVGPRLLAMCSKEIRASSSASSLAMAVSDEPVFVPHARAVYQVRWCMATSRRTPFYAWMRPEYLVNNRRRYP
jgi:hypothetical protein